MRPCLRRRRESAEPRLSRSCTISLTRSPAIPAAECSGSPVSLSVPPQRERQRAVLADGRGGPDRNGRRAGAAGPDPQPGRARLALSAGDRLPDARDVGREARVRGGRFAGLELDHRRRRGPRPSRADLRRQQTALCAEQLDAREAAHEADGRRAVVHAQAVRDRPRASAAGDAGEAALHRSGRTRRNDRDQKSWFSPAKIADTESSEKTLWIVSARIPDTDRTSTLSGFVSGLIGTVSVTITRSKTLS